MAIGLSGFTKLAGGATGIAGAAAGRFVNTTLGPPVSLLVLLLLVAVEVVLASEEPPSTKEEGTVLL